MALHKSFLSHYRTVLGTALTRRAFSDITETWAFHASRLFYVLQSEGQFQLMYDSKLVIAVFLHTQTSYPFSLLYFSLHNTLYYLIYSLLSNIVYILLTHLVFVSLLPTPCQNVSSIRGGFVCVFLLFLYSLPEMMPAHGRSSETCVKRMNLQGDRSTERST